MGSTAANELSIDFQHDQHLAMMKLLRILRKECGELKYSDNFFLALIGAAGISHRGILPASLGDTVIARFITEYGSAIGAGGMRVDHTKFADASIGLFRVCQSADFTSFIEKKLSNLVKAISRFDESCALDHALAPGWFRQCSVKNAGVSKIVVDGHRTRAALTDIPALTQWFTPAWIADFLIQESLDKNSEAVFLDPACGAGHLLLPAVRQLLHLKREQGCSAEAALEHIFGKQLFALDVDREVVALTKLALYMEARDCGEIIELPIANVFTCGDSEEAQAIGSLQLGMKATKFESLPATFDAIAMNPPYLGHRTMPHATREFLKAEFPKSQYDLYAAFLELGMRLLKPGGKLAAICQQSVLTIQRYQALREQLIDTGDIESVAQLGAGVFSSKTGEKTNTAIITLRKRGTARREDVRCWQFLTGKDKSLAAAKGITSVAPNIIARTDADAIARVLPQSPYSFWAPPEILHLFARHPAIDDPSNEIACTNGLFTCNNKKFVCRFDDIDSELRDQFVPYDKGGGHKWYRTSPLMLHWKGDGQEIRDYRVKRGQSAKMPGEQFYFSEGVTYSYIGTKGFKARLLTPNAVFDIASSAIFSSRINTMFILGFLNSSLVRSILGVLNPTVNFQIGDIRRLPFLTPSAEIERTVADLSKRAVAIAKELETFDETSPRFKNRTRAKANLELNKSVAVDLNTGLEVGLTTSREVDLNISPAAYKKLCEQWVEEEAAIQKQLDGIIFDLYEISAPCRRIIESDPWVSRGSESFRKATMSTCKQTV